MTVFTYRCQGCGKQHAVDRSFEQDYTAKCLRCGERVRVTRATIHVAGGAPAVPAPRAEDSITRRKPGTAVVAGAAPVSAAAPVVEKAPLAADDVTGDDYEPPVGEIPLAEMDLREVLAEDAAARKARPRRPPAGPPPAKRRRDGTPRAGIADDTDEGDAAGESPAGADYPTAPPGGAPLSERWRLRERWPLVAGAAVLVVGLVGGGYYALFVGGSKPPEKKEAAAPKPKPKPKPVAPPAPPSTQKEPEKPAPPPLVTKAPDAAIAATRLSAELAADAAGTNAKYKEKLLEVSGVYDKIESRLSGPPPARPHVLFACEGGPSVSLDVMGGATDVRRWKLLPPEQPFTVRAVYRGDGVLYNCELVSLAAPADVKYRGQLVEVVGTVEALILPDARQPFPGLRLEGDTDGVARLECYFRSGESNEVKRLQLGDLVTVRGTCGGRSYRRGDVRVRLENSELVYTSAPVPPAVRRDAIAFLREYEEDLRPFFLPAPGAEPRVEGTLPLSRLNKELAADPAAAKYKNKVVTLSGKLLQRGERELVLVSGNTDEALKVACSFSRQNFEDLRPAAGYTIRGRWAGLDEQKMFRLVSCESADPNAARDPHRVTADYLPHKAGREMTYDVAEYPNPARKGGPVERVVCFRRDGGNTETLITHTGTLTGKGLFDKEEAGKWVEQKKTTKEVRRPGPKLRQRFAAGFVEVGTVVVKNKQEETVWEQVLKVGARTGDTWRWSRDGTTHEFTVERFDEEGGRPRVTVKEMISSPLDVHNRYEKRHVYVRDVGEVEEHDWLLIDSTQRLLRGEKKLLLGDGKGKAPARPGKDFVGPRPQ